uniref:Uncharacterized protein n=1 Tax=Magallana gigas TaxID=29159 RepID=K1PMF7_MAGGI
MYNCQCAVWNTAASPGHVRLSQSLESGSHYCPYPTCLMSGWDFRCKLYKDMSDELYN